MSADLFGHDAPAPAEPVTFTTEQKIVAIKREITMREIVYPARVNSGKMKERDAQLEIAIFRAILADYTATP